MVTGTCCCIALSALRKTTLHPHVLSGGCSAALRHLPTDLHTQTARLISRRVYSRVGRYCAKVYRRVYSRRVYSRVGRYCARNLKG
jgi:hypothetical protein